jgi:hypothetical protein
MARGQLNFPLASILRRQNAPEWNAGPPMVATSPREVRTTQAAISASPSAPRSAAVTGGTTSKRRAVTSVAAGPARRTGRISRTGHTLRPDRSGNVTARSIVTHAGSGPDSCTRASARNMGQILNTDTGRGPKWRRRVKIPSPLTRSPNWGVIAPGGTPYAHLHVCGSPWDGNEYHPGDRGVWTMTYARP